MSSLYVHIPFCASKCPYCDFFSQVGSQLDIEEYVKLLVLNIELLGGEETQISPLKTVFFGGGTPSLLSTQQIETILNCLGKVFSFTNDIEISLEANPGTIDLKKLQGFRQAGVNRLSLGIQSLNDQNLRDLGRIHTAAQGRESVDAARKVGFDNLSLDLIFALPDQNLQDLHQEVVALLDLSPEHLSLYGLSFEEGTRFYSRLQLGELSLCDEDTYADQYLMLAEQLSIAGFEHYEISNFSLPGRACRHNQVYWQRKNCLAIGAGAHSFINRKWGERWYIPANLPRYHDFLMRREHPAELLETYDQTGAMREFVYLALRTSDGIDPDEFERRFKLPFQQVFASELDKIKEYLQPFSPLGRYRLNVRGWLLYDHLISYFL